MKINDSTIKERRVFATFSESEIEELLIKAVANQSGMNMNRNTKTKVLIKQKDRAGTAGYENYAEVTLVNDLPEVRLQDK